MDGTRTMLGLGLLSAALPTVAKEVKRPNVLVIIADDMRPELSCYGHGEVFSPNIDRLARNGVLFSNAYCNIPVSGASRACLMTGIRPLGERFHSFEAMAQDDAPNAVSLPGIFKRNGYTTLSYNKVFHHQEDFAGDWDVNWRPEGPTWRNYVLEENIELEKQNLVASTECADVPDNAYFDGQVAERVISDLRTLSESDNPFFMAVGFVKPHLPFNAPKKYWDLYDRDSIKLPENYELKNGSIPESAFHTWGELRYYRDMPKKGQGQVPMEDAKRLIHGYHACVSYTDAQIGKVLDEVENLGLDDNTVIVFFGDHGWSLGEHGEWCKHSTFDIVMNAPLIISAPGMKKGKTVSKVVEFVDLYPTICDFADIRKPSQLQGKSLKRLMAGFGLGWKNSAVIAWAGSMAIVTPRYAYTNWPGKDGDTKAEMLFDHRNDKAENTNIAPNNRNVVFRMRKIIRKYNKIAAKWTTVS